MQSPTRIHNLLSRVPLAVTVVLCGLIPWQTCMAIHFGEPLPASQHAAVGMVVLLDESGNPTSIGTGTLIAPDLVLTAAHVVVAAHTPYHISFRLDAIPKGDYRGLAYRIHPEYIRLKSISADLEELEVRSQASDVALVRLMRPVVGFDRFPELAAGPPDRSTIATVIGYGQNESKKSGRRLSGKFKFLAMKRGYLMFGAGGDRFQRIDHGDSGGPVLVQANGRTEIVALVDAIVFQSEFKNLVSDEYSLFVSVASHIAWIEQSRKELLRIPNQIGTLVFAVRKNTDAERPAVSSQQLLAMALAEIPAERLLQRVLTRGISDPISSDLDNELLKIGFPDDGFVRVIPPKDDDTSK